MPGYCGLGASRLPATVVLHQSSALRTAPSIFTGKVQVVQPFVWPPVTWAVRVQPPRLTFWPSFSVRSGLTGAYSYLAPFR